MTDLGDNNAICLTFSRNLRFKVKSFVEEIFEVTLDPVHSAREVENTKTKRVQKVLSRAS